MPRAPLIKYIDTAFDLSWVTGTDGKSQVIVCLFDSEDRLLFKVAYDDAEELLARLPVVNDHRRRHKVVYDYAVEKGFIRNPNALPEETTP